MKNFLELLWLNIKVNFFNLIEYSKVVFKYYRNLSFLKSDLLLQGIYFFNNPFSISKRFHAAKGDEEIYVYGETPLTSWETMAKEADISSTDYFIDLGAGRGRLVFWTTQIKGCESAGVEQIPEFMERAEKVKNYFKLTKVHFTKEDLSKVDLSMGTIFYFYNNFVSDEEIKKLSKKLDELPSGTRILSTSFPFSDYSPSYEVSKMFPIRYPWGWADVYLSIKK